MNTDTPKTLSKEALDIDTVLLRGLREEFKDIGFNYEDKVNDAIYLLAVGEVLKIDRKNLSPHWVKRYEDGFSFFQGEAEDDTFARWWSNTTISAYIKKDN